MPEQEVVNQELSVQQDQETETKIKVVKDQRSNIEIVCTEDRTFLVLAAIHRESEKNTISKIPCNKGIAIGGYVYDSTCDSYYVTCAEYIKIGYVPISMWMRVHGVDFWEIRMPLSEKVLKRFLTAEQNKDIAVFKNYYKSDYIHTFIQMVDCNV